MHCGCVCRVLLAVVVPSVWAYGCPALTIDVLELALLNVQRNKISDDSAVGVEMIKAASLALNTKALDSFNDVVHSSSTLEALGVHSLE